MITIKDFINKTKRCLCCGHKTNLIITNATDSEDMTELYFSYEKNVFTVKIRNYFDNSNNEFILININSHKYSKVNHNKRIHIRFDRDCFNCFSSSIYSNIIELNFENGVINGLTVDDSIFCIKDKSCTYKISQNKNNNTSHVEDASLQNQFNFTIKYFNILELSREEILKKIQKAALLQ